MTVHIFNHNLDSGLPATFSKHVQSRFLRIKIDFEGLIFSDDMQVLVIRSLYGLEFSISEAGNAGVDLHEIANNPVYHSEIAANSIEIITGLKER